MVGATSWCERAGVEAVHHTDRPATRLDSLVPWLDPSRREHFHPSGGLSRTHRKHREYQPERPREGLAISP